MESDKLFSEFIQNPLPFCAGFMAGMLQLDLNQDPLKAWLKDNGYEAQSSQSGPAAAKSGPQSISID